ncbi:MAG: methyltransferase family protein [Salinarimonas sp.]
MDVLDFARAALACYFTFIAVFYTAKLFALRARTGRSHEHRGPPGSAQRVGRALFGVFRLAIWGVCVVRVPYPGLDAALGRFDVLYTPAVVASGLLFLVASLALVVYTHSYMSEDWMSGVSQDGPRRLITGGPFAAMRHPLFVAVALGQIGFFLSLPSVFSLVSLLVGLSVLRVQAHVEDRALDARFGVAWRDYAERVPAFAVPGPFRRKVRG